MPRSKTESLWQLTNVNETTVGVFLDLSKAFDTLDLQILFTKLEHYGIRDVALQWIKSYFSCRRQFDQINLVLQRRPLSVEFLKDPY